MNTSFMLGSELVFDSHNMIFHDLKSGKDINLSGVKGRCLMCLINHSDSGVISKKQLFDEVWEQFGLYVSDNNLLQTIYALRRDLKAIGASDLIMTHPRLGYQINPTYLISPYLKLPPDDADSHVDENLLVERNDDVLELGVENTHSEVESKLAFRHVGLKAKLTIHGRKAIVFIIIILSVLMCTLLSVFICDRVTLLNNNNVECASDVFIIENASLPKKSLIACRCDNNASRNKVDWYICKSIK
jgi:DNA-binding winged helix-turn-helix (wHTH) protein